MIEIQKKTKEKAMLVALNTKDRSKYLVEEHLSELEELADTAGADTIFKIVQSRSRFDPAYILAKAKRKNSRSLLS